MADGPKPHVEIVYCWRCKWLLRAAWMAQEMLATFEADLGAVSLLPDEEGGRFLIRVDGDVLWDRKADGGFPQVPELKQRLRDQIAPGRDLGHLDEGGSSRNEKGEHSHD